MQYMNVSIGGDGKEGGFGKYTFISSFTTIFNCLICWDIWNNQLSGFVHNYGGNAEEAFFWHFSYVLTKKLHRSKHSAQSLCRLTKKKSKVSGRTKWHFGGVYFFQFWVNFSSSIVSAEPIRRRKLSTGEIFGFVLFVSFIVYGGALVWLHFFSAKSQPEIENRWSKLCVLTLSDCV